MKIEDKILIFYTWYESGIALIMKSLSGKPHAASKKILRRIQDPWKDKFVAVLTGLTTNKHLTNVDVVILELSSCGASAHSCISQTSPSILGFM